MSWILISAITLGIILWFYYVKTYRYWLRKGIKQTKPWPFLGDAWTSIFQVMGIPQFLTIVYGMYPETRYTGFYQFSQPVLLIKDIDLIKQITVKDFDYFTDHRSFGAWDEVDPLWSRNLFVLRGQRWRDMRALLSGSFTSSKMKIMYSLINKASENFVNYFLNNNENYIEVRMKEVFTRFTNDVIASTSFGIEVDSLKNPTNEFYIMGKEATNFNSLGRMFKFFGSLAFPRFYKIFKITFFGQRVIHFFTSLINETIKVREEKGIFRPDMLNLLIEMKNGIKNKEQETSCIDNGFAVVEESLQIVKHPKRHIEITNMDIAAQAMIFFLAGFDTVSSAMSFTCHELAANPDVQNKLRKEIRETLQECQGNITYEALIKMKYLDMVISESLRKYPALALLDRLCVKPYTILPSNPEEQPVHLIKGNLVIIPVYTIHHKPEYYPEPEKFIPERFSDENKSNIKPYTYFPFGSGPRACIGSRFALMEVKSVLVHLLDKFEIVPTAETQIPLVLSKTTPSLTAPNKFPLGLKRLL